MSYLVLARKWRPQTFDDVIGQEHVTRTLRNAIRSERVAHAFLFTGPRGVGKTTTARLLAKALNCEQGPTPDPCNTCSQCEEITNGSAIDVLEIDGASHTGVDNVRDLTEGVQYRPAKGRFRVVIIDEVHMLSNAAFNALLKTLEEPPAHVKFIFATTESHKILQTILSRCQRYDFKRIALRDLIQQLEHLTQAEGFECDEAGLALLAREADGSLRDAESLLDQVVAWSNGRVDEAAVRDALGVADRQALFRMVEAILAEDPAQVLQLTGDLYQYGYDPRRLCHDLLQHFHDLVVAKVSSDVSVLADLPDHEVEIVRKQAALRSREDLQRFFASLLEAEEAVRRSAYTQLVIEMALVKLASQPPVLPIQEALTKLEELQHEFGSSSNRPASAKQQRFRPSASAGSIGSVGSSGLKDSKRASTPSPPAAPAAAPVARDTVEHLEQGEQWDGFLAMVRSKKISLFFALKAGYLLDETSTVLQIGVDKDPYLKELSRQENRTILEESAEQFFGRKLTIEVQKGKHEPATKGPISPPSEGNTPHQSAPDPAALLVKTALDILGGEIQERRTPRASGTG
jgi:DNA polymerase-3 subunit gamma/tau